MECLQMKLTCVSILHSSGNAFKTRMFTSGKIYNAVKQNGGFLIKDDLGFERFISSSLSFLVSNNDVFLHDIIDHAKANFKVNGND